MPYSDKQRRQFWAQKNALTRIERELIDFYDLQWILRQTVPTIEEVAKQLKQSQVAVNYYLLRPPVIKALNARGIPYLQHTQSELTATQIAVADVMMNFADVRSNHDKLDSLGVSPTQYNAWLRDPQFKNLIDSLSERNLKNIKPTAVTEFTKMISRGEWNAVKYYLDVTGSIESSEAPQSEQMLMMIVEVLQTHIKDQKVLVAIAEDLAKVMGNRTLEPAANQQALTGEYVENDVELDFAKKQLGI